MKSDEYWNPILENLPHEQLELLQFKKFKEIFTWAHEHSKFYNQLYTHAGMAQQYDIKAMAALIESLRQDAEKLKKISNGISTVEKNADRILANVRMLEININDVAEILGK